MDIDSYSVKAFLSATAIALTFIALLPYIRSIRQGKTKPHAFSWIIWGSVTFVAFLAQLAGHGGIGAWPIGISGMLTWYIAWRAYQQRGTINITRLDWWFLFSAMTSLPIWYLTREPLWAVVILTIVDLLGFGPTIRKAWHEPHHERLSLFILMGIRNGLVVMAMETYSLTTILFPAAMVGACLLLIAVIIYRRPQIAHP